MHSTSRSLSARWIAVAAIALLIGALGWSYASDGIVRSLCNPRNTAEQNVQLLRDYFAGFGAAAPLAYVAFVTVEVVVAPIPGTMLYAPGGVVFGGLLGGLLSLIGNVLGAGIACQLMRTLGGDRAEKFLARSALAPWEARLSQRGVWVVFFLRVNPLTSSDLVSYAAGLTHMPVWKVMLGTLLGMAPICFAQSYFADSILTHFPQLIYPLAVACGVYAVVVLWILSKMLVKPAAEPVS